MSQLTEKQIQWFWEQCGLKPLNKRFSQASSYCGQKWLYPDGNELPQPPIDLNNLFKYAVPKVMCYEIFGSSKNSTAKAYIESVETGAAKRFMANEHDPALALFWAIYKAFGGE